MKCFITKLNGVVNNPSILRIGETRIGVRSSSNRTTVFTFNKDSYLEIIGDGYFTNETSAENKGKKMLVNANQPTNVYVSNGEFDCAILDKYSLTTISGSDLKIDLSTLNYLPSIEGMYLPFGQKTTGDLGFLKSNLNLKDISFFNSHVSGDIGGINTLTNLGSLNLQGTQVSGDISGINTLTNLTYLNLQYSPVSGDISGINTLTKLETLKLQSSQVSGDIVNLRPLTSLKIIQTWGTTVTGDIANFKYLTSLNEIAVTNMTGNIGELSSLSNLETMALLLCNLTGDISKLPNSFRYLFIEQSNGSNLTWVSRNSSAKIIALHLTVNLDNIDKMLQDQAECQIGYKDSDGINYKSITVKGNRTSASDAAVATLQQKGYTVSITPA